MDLKPVSPSELLAVAGGGLIKEVVREVVRVVAEGVKQAIQDAQRPHVS
jgi:hypothetical protein